jgi:hypothetical protein
MGEPMDDTGTKIILALLIGIVVGGAATFAFMERENAPVPPVQVTAYPTPSVAPVAVPTPTIGPAGVGGCSAAAHVPRNPELTNQGLPPAVDVMRKQIIAAASACDYQELNRLALAGKPEFSYSFGVEQSPADFWRDREREARRLDQPTSEYLRYLVEVLYLPYCIEETSDRTYYVWPRVHCSERQPADWDDLQGLYADEVIEQMRAGDIYYGHRVGILADGDWAYFIAGD